MQQCLLCNAIPTVKITLECDHTFCYLCIKTYALMDSHCPECNSDFSIEKYSPIINDLNITDQIDTNINYIWLYSSNNLNKWWCYDKSTNVKIEEIYNKYLLEKQITGIVKQTSRDFKIGHLKYEIEFTLSREINQVSLLDKNKKRNVKRLDVNNFENIIMTLINDYDVIGISGIKF